MATVNFKEGATAASRERVLTSTIRTTDSDMTDLLKLVCKPSVTLAVGDDINYYDTTNTLIFAGKIKSIVDKGGVRELTVPDYSIELTEKLVNEVYENQSPEAIIESIIDTTSLTYVSAVSSGVTISKIVFQDERAIDVIRQLLQIFQGQLRVDKNKNAHVEVREENAATVSIDTSEAVNVSGWKTDTSSQATKLIVKGATIVQRTTETLSGTGTVFNTTYKPIDVYISGFTQTTQNIDGDYEVDIENKTITFDSSQTDPEVEYSYESQIRVEVGDGDIEKEIVKEYIEKNTEARRVGRKYLSIYDDGVQSATFKVKGRNHELYPPNYSINVNDTISQPNVAGAFKILKVVRKYPGTMEVTVGEKEADIFDYEKETRERLKQLEKRKNNTDFITKDVYLQPGITVTFTIAINKLRVVEDDGTILFASETTLATDADLISDTGADVDYATAYDESALPAGNVTDYV